ncbi:MAG: Mov34/MPN/PAD-1 family protein [Thermoproteota archaeon]
MVKKVKFERQVLEGLLRYAQMVHPREGILLLRGKVEGDNIIVEETVIPPFATHGQGFSGFPLSNLPIDFSIVGVAHSHPSGVAKLSTVDQNQFYGNIMAIITSPYQSQKDITVYNTEGKNLIIEIIH